ncbi:MAG: hypothetical protein HQ504_06285 [Rhodospirillaceae bacterium]|nr:hypothetical protein [Rhodospirillaceae bacterium]
MPRFIFPASAVLVAFLIGPPAHAQFNPLSIIKGAIEAAAEDRKADDIKKKAFLLARKVKGVKNLTNRVKVAAK